MPALILSHDTALAYWSHPSARRLPTLSSEQANWVLQSAGGVTHIREINDFLNLPFYGDISSPVDLLVPGKGEARATSRAHFHYCKELPAGSLSIIDGSTPSLAGKPFLILVCSPELVLVQMATLVSDIELLEIGYELCGSYTLHPYDGELVTRRPPVTSPETITRFLENARDIPGIGQARRVIRWIIGMSRSPKETQLAILSVLPLNRGGFKLPHPLLNEPLPVEPHVAAVLGAAQIVPDLLWADHGIVLEYDSNLAHTQASAPHDARKRTAYHMMGLKAVGLTNDQLNDYPAFENIMRNLEKRMVSRRKPATPEQIEKRMLLYDWLFHGKRRWRKFFLQR